MREAASLRKQPGPIQEAELTVPASPTALAQLRASLGDLGLPSSLLEDTRLLVTELVTNSLKHSELDDAEDVRVRIRWSETGLRVDVFDHPTDGRPSVVGAIRPDPGAESGWGLFMVDRLSSRWGNMPGHYWFEMQASS